MDDESTKKSGKKTDRQTFGLMFVFAIGILIGFAIMASLSIPLASWSAQSSLPPATSGSAPENPNSPENAKEREALTSDATVRGIISKVVEELSARTETTSKLTEATYVHIKELFGIAGLVISIFAAVNIWSAFEARNSLDKYKKEIEDLIEKEKNDAHQKFSNLLALQTEQQLLVRQVADLEEPFVRHELHAREQQIIDQYLQKLEELRNNPGDDALSFYDFEQAGYANHFLATTNSGFNKEEQRRRDREAVTYYKLALQKYDPKSEKIMDRRSCSINRQLGNAQVGLGEYASALNLYQRLIKSCPIEKALLYLSMGFAYKGTEEYLYAAYCFRKAMTESLSEQQSFPRNRGDQRICVEAYYEGANALTAIGQYKDAIESYNDALKYAKECAFPQQWFRKSLGDAIRKRGNSGQSSTDYADSRDKYQQEAEYNKQALGSPAFGIGQTYLGEALLGSEREPTAGNDTLFRKAVNWFESAWSEGCTNPLLFAYWGYALKMITRSDNPEFKDHLSRAIEAQHKNEKDNPGNAQVNYDLAVCYAMNEDVTEALEYLNKAFAKSDAAYCWALQMDSADFAGIRKSPRWKVEEERIKVRVERIKKEWEELKTSDSCCDFA